MKKAIIFLLILCSVIMFLQPKCVFGEAEEKEVPYPIITQGEDFFVQDGVGYYLMSSDISSVVFNSFIRASKVFDRLKVNKIVIILNSPGGSVFDAIGFTQLMGEQKNKGIIVETRCYGLAASAAAIVISAGTKGHRYIAEGSFMMIHELSSFKFLSVESVSDTEKDAKIKRQIQDEIIAILARNTKLSKESLTSKCREESWFNAKTAIKWGFVDNIIQ
jgi:ATP-dependent Clp endopeptidase proteolytic subunit ClpP